MFVFCFGQEMIFKMKEHFVIFVFLVILFNDCNACFKENTVANYSITSSSGFYADCCCVEDGYTIANLTWLRPNNSLIGPAGADSDVYIQNNEDEEGNKCISLVTPSASTTLSGTYKCVTNYNGVLHHQIHNLDVYDPLFFINTSPKQYLVDHIDSRINCTARGASPPRFRWSRGKDGEQEIVESEKYTFLPEGLLVRNVSDADAGIYKCTALVLSTSEEVELNIDVEIMTVPVIQQLRATPEETVVAGESLQVECVAQGFPTPEYIWRKIPAPKSSNETRNVTWHQEYNTILFEGIEVEDGGIYECYVHNFAGSNSATIEIKVLVPPTITSFPNQTIVEGGEVGIQCIADGNPMPNITITYEGKSLEEEKSTYYDQFIDNYSLLKVNRSKEGFYICNASNEVDFVTEVMYLTVLHPPSFENSDEIVWGWNGESVELSCEHEANPPANLTWRYQKVETSNVNEAFVYEELQTDEVKKSHKYSLNVTKNYAPYGQFGCIAINGLGEATRFMTFKKGSVPSEVVNSSIVDITANSATFEIEVPFSFEGPDVLGFKAEYDFIENYDITDIHRNRTWSIDRSFKLDKLKPNSTYLVRFAALNRVGAGPWGERLIFGTLEKSAPEPPIWQVDSPQFPSNNVLKWKAPEDNGEPIDFYVLRYCPALEDLDESLCKEQSIEEATELEITNLEFNTTYNFELIAHNAEGNSTAANISLSVPVPISEAASLLSGGAIIGISIVLVFVCLILLDLLLLFWRRQGIIASCCYKKSKKKPNPINSRDKKVLLKDNVERTDDTLRRPNNGHREYEYNKTTGIITGKHSSV